MKRAVRWSAVTALTAAAIPAAHAAAANDSAWGVALFGADSVNVNGSMLDPVTNKPLDFSTLNPAFEGSGATFTGDRLHYDDAYHRRYSLGTEVSYHPGSEWSAFGRLSYNRFEGRTQTLGKIDASGITSPIPLEAQFQNMDSWALDLGSRYYFMTGEALRPFAGIALGATHMQPMRASLSVPGTDLTLSDTSFSQASTVFTQNVEAGVDYGVGDNLDLRLSIAATHIDSPSAANDPQLAALGIVPTHESLWDYPVTLGAVYRFD